MAKIKGWNYEKKISKFGRIDENWKTNGWMINLHKAHIGWMVTIYNHNKDEVADIFYSTKIHALESITIIKNDINRYWNYHYKKN